MFLYSTEVYRKGEENHPDVISALDPCVAPQQEVQHTALKARHALSGTISVIFSACVYVELIDLLCLNSVSGVLFSSAGRT